ncbi:alpha/beta hydrolase [Pseudomonas sp. Je.1.5.c]|uniref:alpha/beta hydrolase n=1 Tax=Pseudomonas sp. Je.1.5.c TaxID=3142839 RepID=UPI003DA7C101
MTTPLYRNFTTRQALDEQYDVEQTVPDFGQYVSHYVESSAIAREQLTCSLDIRYGASVEETVDIFYPSDATASVLKPAVFFIHGGFWKATTSKEWSFVAQGLAKLGVVTVVENYTLCPKVSVAEIIRQHRAAYAYVWNNAARFGIDRNRIVLVGHSVGGHGVAELLATQLWGDYGLAPTPYKAAIAVSGLFDVRPIPHTFAGPILGLSVSDAESLSPYLRISNNRVPLQVVVGEQETDEFIRQSLDYITACSEQGWEVEKYIAEKNHFDILDEFFHGEGVMIDYLCHHLALTTPENANVREDC